MRMAGRLKAAPTTDQAMNATDVGAGNNLM
jgi:hypothetical protein